MTVLFYRWQGITEEDALEVLNGMGVTVIPFEYPLKDYNEDYGLEEKVKNICQSYKFECVFSFNYFPALSRVCCKIGIKYISWVYDSPHFTLNSRTVLNDCNEIYVFDYCLYYKMITKQRGNVHHLPLAVNAKRLLRQEASYGRGYQHEVSFMGHLYQDQYNFYDQIQYWPEYLKGYTEGSMEAQLKIYGYDFLEEQFDDAVMKQILKYVDFGVSDNYFPEEKEIFLNSVLRRKMTVIERQRILEAVSRRFQTALYSGGGTSKLPMVKHMGYAEYLKQMPEMFKRSKVNLNITLRSILSGIPLRVLDIMGAGGFALSNYQIEIEEYFKLNEEIVVYDSIEDCLEKIEYYLAHEEEREKIAEKGCRKVRREFSYENQFRKIFGEKQ